MSNVEGMNSASHEIWGRQVYFKNDRAKRFHPSTFCGLIFDILRFAVPTMFSFIQEVWGSRFSVQGCLAKCHLIVIFPLIINFTCIFFLHFLICLYIQPHGFSFGTDKRLQPAVDRRYIKDYEPLSCLPAMANSDHN